MCEPMANEKLSEGLDGEHDRRVRQTRRMTFPSPLRHRFPISAVRVRLVPRLASAAVLLAPVPLLAGDTQNAVEIEDRATHPRWLIDAAPSATPAAPLGDRSSFASLGRWEDKVVASSGISMSSGMREPLTPPENLQAREAPTHHQALPALAVPRRQTTVAVADQDSRTQPLPSLLQYELAPVARSPPESVCIKVHPQYI